MTLTPFHKQIEPESVTEFLPTLEQKIKETPYQKLGMQLIPLQQYEYRLTAPLKTEHVDEGTRATIARIHIDPERPRYYAYMTVKHKGPSLKYEQELEQFFANYRT